MYCIEYKCNLFSNLKLKYVSSLIELRGGYVVVLWIVGRGARVRNLLLFFETGNFVQLTLSLSLCRYSKSRSSFLPGVYVISQSEKWKQIYRGLANFRVLPLGNEINNKSYIN